MTRPEKRRVRMHHRRGKHPLRAGCVAGRRNPPAARSATAPAGPVPVRSPATRPAESAAATSPAATGGHDPRPRRGRDRWPRARAESGRRSPRADGSRPGRASRGNRATAASAPGPRGRASAVHRGGRPAADNARSAVESRTQQLGAWACSCASAVLRRGKSHSVPADATRIPVHARTCPGARRAKNVS